MPTATRRILATAAFALTMIAVGGAAATAAPLSDLHPTIEPAEPIEFKTVATFATVGTAGLARGVAIRVADPDDLARLEQILDDAPPAEHPIETDPDEPTPGDAVIGAIESAYPRSLPGDAALLVGLVSGCSPDPAVVRDSDGEAILVDSGSDPNVECLVAYTIIAVVEVAEGDVPVGGADRATLQQFEFVGNEPVLPVSDDELPPVADGDRRITAIVSGCRDTTAELVVSESVVATVAKNQPDEPDYLCAQAEFFVATFDIAANLIPDTAQVPSTSGA